MVNKWTELEDKIILENYGKKSNEEIGELINRNARSVSIRARKLNLSTYKFWSKAEIEFLRENYDSMTLVDISKYLKKSPATIHNKANRMKMASHIWSKEEEEFLMDNCHKGRKFLCKNLNRSLSAINHKIYKLGISDPISYMGFITLNCIFKCIYGKKKSSRLEMCIKAGMPYRKYKCVSGKVIRYTDIDSFWHWAKKHQDILDFSKFEPLILGREPDWVVSKRKIDTKIYFSKPVINKGKRGKSYTQKEVNFIFNNSCNMTIREMASKLQRSCEGIRHFVQRNNLEYKRENYQPCFWSKEEDVILTHPFLLVYMKQEDVILKELHKYNYNYEEIANKLGRSISSVKHRKYFLIKKGLWA